VIFWLSILPGENTRRGGSGEDVGWGPLGRPRLSFPLKSEQYRFFERLDRDIVQVRKYSNTQKIK